jgi:hypothetical protein
MSEHDDKQVEAWFRRGVYFLGLIIVGGAGNALWNNAGTAAVGLILIITTMRRSK